MATIRETVARAAVMSKNIVFYCYNKSAWSLYCQSLLAMVETKILLFGSAKTDCQKNTDVSCHVYGYDLHVDIF